MARRSQPFYRFCSLQLAHVALAVWADRCGETAGMERQQAGFPYDTFQGNVRYAKK